MIHQITKELEDNIFFKILNKFFINFCYITVFCFLYLFQYSNSYSHGGLSLEDDYCVLRLGAYKIHFSGYQPENNGPKEFCEDIPEVGKTIVVLDFIDRELRGWPLEVRIIKDVEDQTNIENITIYHKAFNTYPNGTLNFKHTFENKGKYVGLVTTKKDEFITSRFPFSVGIDKKSNAYIYYIIFSILFGACIFYIARKIHVKTNSQV